MKNNVLNFFGKTVEKFGERVAVRDKDNALTFNQLDCISRNLACEILELDESVNKPIALFLPKSVNQIVSLLGVLYSGNFYMPLDIKSPVNRLRSIIDNVKPNILITEKKYFKLLESLELKECKIIYVDTDNDDQSECSFLNEKINNLIDTDPVYLINTSGSTGVPKGVLIPHRGVIDYIEWATDCFSIDENTIIGNQAPYYFDNSTLDIYLSFATGAELVLIPEEYFVFPAKLLEFVKKSKVNFIFWVPSVIANIANMKLLDSFNITCLETILFAGEVMSNKHLNYWRKKLPGAIYANLYGPTEITVDCTYYVVDRDFKDDEPLPIGISCRNTDVIILNEKNERAGINELGELCVRGSSLALGYYNDLEKTNLAFVQNPLNSMYPEKIYKTGDLVYVNDRGEIIFSGRKDSQIKHLGYRIELGEIENVVSGLKGIDNLCVLYNSIKKEITMFFESKIKFEQKHIRGLLSKHLPRYMLPRTILQLERIPINSNGKIDRKAIAKMYF